VVIVVALLLAVQVVRNSAVAALSELQPAKAKHFWAAHPAVELSLGLLGIAQASRAHRHAPPASFAMIDDAARKSPLSPEPYLVHGVQAQLSGDTASAKRDFGAAQWRDPRSLPAAYFLAEYYFRQGRPIDGLRQTAILARLSPAGITTVAPFVAAYAQDPSNWPQIRDMFTADPSIEDSVLLALAQNAGNAGAILALADSKHRNAASLWVPVLLRSLIDSGQYAKAHAIWAAVARVKTTSLLYDSTFEDSDAPPPFNWALTSSTVGLAERQPERSLHAIFYGSQDGVLASQLLLLPPGSYRMQYDLAPSATHADAMSWSIRCDKSNEAFATAALDAADNGWSFRVPANCPAQWLELSGRSADITQQSDVTISGLRLMRIGGRG